MHERWDSGEDGAGAEAGAGHSAAAEGREPSVGSGVRRPAAAGGRGARADGDTAGDPGWAGDGRSTAIEGREPSPTSDARGDAGFRVGSGAPDVSDAERLARAALTYLAEPADPLMTDLVAKLGPVEILAAVRGSGLDSIDRMPRWRARLARAHPEADVESFARQGGRIVCPGDPEWPSQLNDLGRARPYAMWLLGNADLDAVCRRSVAVVGSREASPYGRHIAAEMAAELADRGWCVVSGGAFGIDAAAHRGALAAEGSTVAVLGGGTDALYPRDHAGLFSELVRHGVLVSEVPPHVHPIGSRFIVRNRLIAAFSRGTVVVEAAARSGALNTATHARRLFRAVMVVPGPVTSRTSAGCHIILREWGDAAICVTNAAEVIEHVGAIGTDLAPATPDPPRPRDALDGTTRAVLEAIPSRNAQSLDAIAVDAGVDLDTALASLGELVALGLVGRSRDGWHVLR